MRALVSALTLFVLLVAGVTTAGAQDPAGASSGQGKEKRIAFVVGNESYAAGALPTAANDAGLIAQTLQAAGFEVVGARDLDADTLRQSYADFIKKVSDAGPNTVAFVYLAGYGLQYGTDNFFVPIGATIARDADIPIETIRLSDLTGPLVTLNLKARFLVFDAAYKTPFKTSGAPLAEGFSLIDAGPGTLIAYNSAPGTVAPVGKENYGVYAQSLAAMLREGGLPPDEIFDRVRLRVNDVSKGAEVPWDSSKIDAAFRFFQRGKNAPPPAATPEQTVALTQKPLKELPVKQAYTAAVARDTIQSYEQFTAVYPSDPLAKRARVLLAARREAITWRRTISVDTPAAYWSYLSRYPRGPHAADARVRLGQLSAQEAPPPDYEAIAYDVPPPPPEEIVYVDQPVIYFDDPEFVDYAPPPPPPDYWLPPVPVAFIDLPPPPPPPGLFFLPVPAFVPLPVYYDPPPYVVFPTGDYFYGGYGGDVPYAERIQRIHEGFPAGGPRGGFDERGGPNRGAVIGAAALGAAAVALPAAALARSNAFERRGITTPAQLNALRRQPGGLRENLNGAGGVDRRGAPGGATERNALPGANGRPLPTPGPAGAGANARENALEQRRNDVRERQQDRQNAVQQRRQDQRNAVQERQQRQTEQRNAVQQRRQDQRNAVQERQQERQQQQRNAVEQRQQRQSEQRNAVQQRRQDQRNAVQERQQERQQQQRNAVEQRQQRQSEQRNAIQQRQQQQRENAGQQRQLMQERQQMQQRQQVREPQSRPGGYGGGAPGPRPGGFGGGGAPGPRPGGFGGGAPGPRPGGGGGGPHPGGGGGGHPGGGPGFGRP